MKILISLDLIIALNTLLASFILMLVTCLFVIKSFKIKRQHYESRIEEEIEKNLNNFLISSAENEGLRHQSVDHFHMDQFNRFLNRKFNRGIFVKKLIDLKRNLEGEFKEILIDLFDQLGLYKMSILKIKHRKWAIQVRGIQEMSEMEYRDGFFHILNLLSSRNSFLRQEAQIALVKLSTRAPLFFLENGWRDLTSYHQLRLFHELNQSDFKSKIQFDHWLQHPSKEVVQFIIHVSLMFKRLESMPLIRSLIKFEDEQVRLWILKAISEMGDSGDIDLVKRILKETESIQLKVAGLETLIQIGTPNELDLAIAYLDATESVIKISAVRLIAELSGDLLAYQVQHPEIFADREDLQEIVNHVMEPLNKHQ